MNLDISMLCEELEEMGGVFLMQRKMKINKEKLLQIGPRPISISTLTKLMWLPQTAAVKNAKMYLFHVPIRVTSKLNQVTKIHAFIC